MSDPHGIPDGPAPGGGGLPAERPWRVTDRDGLTAEQELQLMARRRERVAVLADVHARRQATFFTRLDERTHESWLMGPEGGGDGEVRQRMILDLAGLLGQRLRARARGFRPSDPTSDGGPLPGGADLEAVRFVSALLLELADDFGPRGSDAQARELGLALDAFACGDLRMDIDGLVVCQPNSGMFLAFAEFAFLAHEVGVDRPVWASLLRTMVRSQSFFVCSYGDPHLERMRLPWYRHWRREGVPGPTQRELLRRQHWSLDVDALSRESSRIAQVAVLV